MRGLWWPFRAKRSEDLESEIQAHLAMARRDREERGESPEVAEREARREFGNRTLVAEVTREMWGWSSLERIWQDIRYGGWMMRRSVAFSTVAILSLALGIGANTAIFTMIDAVMLQWLPVQDPAHLVLFNDGIETGVYSGDRGVSTNISRVPTNIFSYPSWTYLRAHNNCFEDLAAFRQSNDDVAMRVSGTAPDATSERAVFHLVSGNYFGVLGVPAAIGRVLRPADDTVNAPPVAVISYPFWQQRFHLDSKIVGQTVLLNKSEFTIIGVAARDFFGERIRAAPDFWLPLSFQPQLLQSEPWFAERNVYWLNFLGRLKPGAAVEQAEASLSHQLQIYYLEQTGSHPSLSALRELHQIRVVLKPGGTGISGLRYLYSKPLHLLMAVVGLVLLIACANLATLLLARSSARRREFLARIALGASPSRIVRQVLTESMLLSFFGGLVGSAFAWWSLKGLVLMLRVPAVVKIRPDPIVLAFTFVATILTGILFGLIPAIRFSRLECVTMSGSRATGRGQSRFFSSSRSLIVLQIALSFVLLAGTALLTRSLLKLERQDVGFSRTNILVVRTDMQLAGYTEKNLLPLYHSLDARLNQIPGVASASLVRYTPVSGSSSSGNFSIEGYTPHSGQEMDVHRVEVAPRFFDTLEIPLLLGRPIGPRDTPDTPPVAVVNSAFVTSYFPQESPLGRRFSLGSPFKQPGFEIVGVAANSKYYDLRELSKPMAFLAAWQHKGDSVYANELVIRTAGSPLALAPEAQRVLKDIDKSLPVIKVTTLDHQLDESLSQQKLLTDLCSIFGAVALILSAIGIYGTIAYTVARRTIEIGIRMAIGAPRERVLWMMVRESVALTVIGLGLGVPLALFAARWIKSFLFGIRGADPLAIAAAILLVTIAALTAGYLPAHRATKIDPMRALKYE